ncbi:MAG: hypothetical protein JSW64_08705 [Candidatus Zixiibacteriota bacterium]|nr:MAG: hypothetical protein JSW64_08705 [candidate division Zixibacteria bacterium]
MTYEQAVGWGFIPQRKHHHREESNAVRRRSDLKIRQMIRRRKLDFLALSIILSFLFAVACPPPDYSILFGYNGEWEKSLKIKESPIVANITGHIRFYGWSDQMHIEIAIEGLDTSKIVFFDSTLLISGRTINTTNYFNDKVMFESEIFRPFYYDIYKRKHRIELAIGGIFDTRKGFDEMTKDEFFTYLDMLNGRIHIVNIFSEPKLIEVKMDKKKLIKKLRGRVSALREK